MTWLDQLQPASFRGVPFHVDTIEHTAGDNVVLREYPFQDLPTVFRMGEAAEEIKFSAYVIGDDYIEQREALREVLTGEGLLVHPTAGAMQVYVNGKFQIKENPTAEGGMARFDLVFIRAETRRYPAGVPNTDAQAVDAADAMDEAAWSEFETSFALADVPGWAGDRALSRLMGALDVVWSAIGPVLAALPEMVDFVAEGISAYQRIKSDFGALLQRPGGLVAPVGALFAVPVDLDAPKAVLFQAAMQSLFNMPAKLVQNDFEVVQMPVGGLLAMYGAGDAAVLGVDSAARSALARLNASADQLVETLATTAWLRATVQVELGGYDQALAMRSLVGNQCKRLLVSASARSAAPKTLLTGGLAWHDAMAGLQRAALGSLQERSRNLVRLSSYAPGAFQPVWYVSYALYGTAAYADEIMALNPHIVHPMLVPPGKPLRVARHD